MNPINAAALGLAAGLAVGFVQWGHTPPIRVLVGMGCDGPSTIAIASAAEALPRCDQVEIHQLSGGLYQPPKLEVRP